MFLSFFIVSTDYIGEQKDISNCKSDDSISVVCGLSNPEDIVITPDQNYFLMSESGGIRPYHETTSGAVALRRIFETQTIPRRIPLHKNTS